MGLALDISGKFPVLIGSRSEDSAPQTHASDASDARVAKQKGRAAMARADSSGIRAPAAVERWRRQSGLRRIWTRPPRRAERAAPG
jgi:hypothetical protein